ncbi:MAG: hypothetical protein Unbinned3907contig1000_20 [Prokaryotic dsDNA virus sp.]|nr:MAG: hypothetical protein Unbinned3907contig1000_20 [Prokaryotic dsDNA virus sp.]|tara:strand:+ start:1016 stop:1285 length:270 start_codon:yes stop_codon:yes gene_type:complete
MTKKQIKILQEKERVEWDLLHIYERDVESLRKEISEYNNIEFFGSDAEQKKQLLKKNEQRYISQRARWSTIYDVLKVLKININHDADEK